MLLLETIRLENGQFNNLNYHFNRMQRTMRELFKVEPRREIEIILNDQTVPQQGLFKCRIIYDTEIREIDFVPYAVRALSGLSLIHDDTIEYGYKFLDRTIFEKHLKGVSENEDILIVKNGLITDTSYSNIIFKLNDRWVTPKDPLLNGTMRQFLIDARIISEMQIRLGDLSRFSAFTLVNSMIKNEIPPMEMGKIH